MKVSPSATSALSGFLSAVLAPEVSKKPVASSIPAESGQALHFSVLSEEGQAAHLTICAVVKDGEPLLEGCLFDGDPFVVAAQAKEWLRERTLANAISPSEAPHESNDAIGQTHLIDATSPPPLVKGTELIKLRTYREQLSAVQEVLRARGFSTGLSSRVGQYLKSLDAYVKDRSDKTVGPALQAIFEARQIGVIFEELTDQLSDSQIKYLLSGHFTPDTEFGTSAAAGRNYQFELYVAAICKRAGFEVTLREPDMHVRWGNGELVIAAKRIQSNKMLTSRMKEANRQITKSEILGIIFADLTPIYNPEHRFLRVFSQHRAKEILSKRVERFVERNRADLTNMAGPNTVAYLFHAAMPVVWVGHEMGSYTSLEVLGVKASHTPEASAAREFTRIFGAAMFGLDRK